MKAVPPSLMAEALEALLHETSDKSETLWFSTHPAKTMSRCLGFHFRLELVAQIHSYVIFSSRCASREILAIVHMI